MNEEEFEKIVTFFSTEQGSAYLKGYVDALSLLTEIIKSLYEKAKSSDSTS